ncbi:Uma2 family endonuclease [Geitlerinema sp. P-1104]|uniref:Uma2 family endonuclease n=1 Tax=Geitlerinema sp. P-1104 TaxID=2546230 RepID=UPI0014774C6C|nr:Uma2 family endonuclease [Geitlerinema sp. P-1104]NMG59235.1 Uma2 family endonuclease [Geitlerinema sp. P-1104]
MVAIPAGFSPEEYLRLEEQALTRHEFRCGLVYAMAGGSANHNRITINLLTAFNLHFTDDRCQFFSGDVKLNYAERFYYYPDAFVTCDPRDREDSYIKRYPTLIAEVMSPSTSEFDRGSKFEDYRCLASLEEYVLISQEVQRVEVFSRGVEGWSSRMSALGEQVRFESIGLEVAMGDLYRGTDVLA